MTAALDLAPARTLARARRDVMVFSYAAAIVALHAVVDAFVAPEPGTGPGDHLLRGLVTLSVLGLATVVYPRLPTGGRAALAAGLESTRAARPRVIE